MSGHRIGYIRVSTFDQNPERQLETVPVDKVFTDKASGKDVRRPRPVLHPLGSSTFQKPWIPAKGLPEWR